MSSHKPKLWQVIRSVLAAFIGIQSEKNRRMDFQSNSVLPFIIVAIAMALLFAAGLLILVKLVS